MSWLLEWVSDMDNKTKTTLNELLYGSQGAYGHMFPFRDRVPTINKHIFTDLKHSKDSLDEAVLSRMLDIQYIGWTAKVVLGIDLFPIQIAILQMMWNTPFPMLVACRGGSKSYMLAIYAILKALFDPGTKIVIIGAGLRQARLVFNYIDTIWSNSSIFRNIVGGGKNAGPRQNVDLCYFKIGDSIVYALPTGDGTKIRGFRANIVIADEFACLDKDTLVETNNGLERISDISDNGTNIINRYGDFEPIDSFVKTPKTDVYEVSMKYGYGFKCSNIHKVLTTNGWKLGKDLTNRDFLVIKNQYVFPSRSVDSFITEDIAWLIGLLISDGDVTNKHYISIRTIDQNLVERFTTKFAKLDPKVYMREAYVDKRGWKCKKSYEIKIHNTSFRGKLYALGIDYVGVAKKTIPSSILKSPKNIVVSFLSGLFEGDGSCFLWHDRDTIKLGVAYYTISDILAQDIQTLLLKFDIIISRNTRASKLSDKKQWMLRCNGRYALNIAKLLNIPKWNDLLPKAQTYFHPNDYGITFDKSRDKWQVAINYSGKVHHLGRYVDKNDAKRVARDFIKTHDLCIRVKKVCKLSYRDHLYDFHLPNTHSFYGNGFVQHNSVPEDVFDIVVRGFAATTKTPVEEAKKIAFDKQLAKIDIPSDVKRKLVTTDNKMHGNQIIYSGTAYYAFNHFA
ncbi:MAG: LAGLIDADG family homing endonuclease, partial [Candidatus Neomarinimicrobiota bacterium]